jgi:hypothetical protein
MSKTIYMGTTKIPVFKTASEVQDILRRSGAQHIAMEYGADQSIRAMRFTFPIDGQVVSFELPVRVAALMPKLRNDKAQAERVAWRQLLRWVEAQLAMIEVGMVKPAEVYTPYRVMPDGRLLGEALLAQGGNRLLLEAGQQ